jgi:calcium permeable stress-gated cation channel
MYKYLFLWVYQQDTDTGGLFFPKALQHLFVGLYVEQVCVAALFFLSEGSNGKQNAVPEGALMIVLIIFTVRHRLFSFDDVFYDRDCTGFLSCYR